MPHKSKSPTAVTPQPADATPAYVQPLDKPESPSAPNDARVVQADAPVDVPRTPAPPDATTPDVAREQSKPPRDPDDGHSWADNTLPAPNKKNARTNLF